MEKNLNMIFLGEIENIYSFVKILDRQHKRLLVKIAGWVNSPMASSHNHIKMTIVEQPSLRTS